MHPHYSLTCTLTLLALWVTVMPIAHADTVTIQPRLRDQSAKLTWPADFGWRRTRRSARPAPVTALQAMTIYFATNQFAVPAPLLSALRTLGQQLQTQPTLTFTVHGHTDHVGSTTYNQGLSEQRAGAVAEQIRASGARTSQLVIKGFGEQQPVDDNGSAAGRARNRRCEVRLRVVDTE